MPSEINIRFDNKTAIVTGAGRGIGRDIAERLYLLGAKVIAVSRSADTLEELRSACPNITTVQCDLGNWAETKQKLGLHATTCDLLVNNAATSASINVGDITEDQVDTMFNVNYKGCLNLTQLVLPGMKERRFGSIVNISSMSSRGAFDGHCVYGATKTALDMLTKSVASEYGQYNIRCNSVNPTVVWTEMGQAFWSDEIKNTAIIGKIPAGRFVKVNEVTEPVLFLLSEYSTMINGVLLPIDGGLSARG